MAPGRWRGSAAATLAASTLSHFHFYTRRVVRQAPRLPSERERRPLIMSMSSYTALSAWARGEGPDVKSPVHRGKPQELHLKLILATSNGVPFGPCHLPPLMIQLRALRDTMPQAPTVRAAGAHGAIINVQVGRVVQREQHRRNALLGLNEQVLQVQQKTLIRALVDEGCRNSRLARASRAPCRR